MAQAEAIKINMEEELPRKVEDEAIYSIDYNKTETVHGFVKYPCKFIPAIPRWAIEKYSKPGDNVLDPFMGSGTTLVEAIRLGRKGLGIDFDLLSHLITKVKCTVLTEVELKKISEFKDFLSKKYRGNTVQYKPEMKNLDHWFENSVIEDLAYIKKNIFQYGEHTNKRIENFLMVTFSGIIKKVSNADNQSPKPYVSSKIHKDIPDVFETFFKKMELNIKGMLELRKDTKNIIENKLIVIGRDARKIDYSEKIDLAVTSPPYINAFDYVRSLKLENYWVGNHDGKNLVELKKEQIGTESIYAKTYKANCPETGLKKLDKTLEKIYKKDKKRAHVVAKFFDDMRDNLVGVYNSLKEGGKYIIIVGNNNVRGFEIETWRFLLKTAEEIGYFDKCKFGYEIKNHYINFPRGGKGGKVNHDHIIVLEK